MEARSPQSAALRPPLTTIGALAPGIALSAAVAVAAYFLAPPIARIIPIPAMVIALIIGMALNRVSQRPVFQPGMVFCVKTMLRWAVALLGLRIALADIAALATSTVVPNYKGKQADIAFVVVAVNALATIGMVVFPPLCTLLGFDDKATGVMLGGTIHDVAQVVGAGYGASEAVGNTAVIVKLFRVFLLLPCVLAVGWYFTAIGSRHDEARVPVPVFALVFLALCILNSAIALAPGLGPIYAPVRAGLIEVSTWGLLIAIGALGLGTSISAIIALGWRHVLTVMGTTAVIFIIVTGGLMMIVML